MTSEVKSKTGTGAPTSPDVSEIERQPGGGRMSRPGTIARTELRSIIAEVNAAGPCTCGPGYWCEGCARLTELEGLEVVE